MPDFWKNRKALVYIALSHHTRFLSPVMDRLAKQGADIQYVVGQAERSQEITAINLGLNYTHVFDCVSDKDHTDVQDNYLRLKKTFVKTLSSGHLFNAVPVTVIDKTLYATAVEYIGFRNLIQKTKPDICFALHELNRWGKMFAFWAKKFNIPVLTFQEGLYYGLDFGLKGHVQNSTLNLVWGNRIKKKLVDYEAPEEKILPVGNTHLANEIAHQKKNNIRDKKRVQYNCTDSFVILILLSGRLPIPQELIPLFDSMVNTDRNRLFLKFHPVASQAQINSWLSSIPKEHLKRTNCFHNDENTYDLISMSDLCVMTRPSTTGLEALSFGKPLVQLELNMEYKSPYSFSNLKVAVQMTPSELGDAILKNMDFNTLSKTEDIDNYLNNELSCRTDAVDAVADVAQKAVSANQIQGSPPIKILTKTDKDWSIIAALTDNPDHLLMQLEAIAVHSKNAGAYEVILIEPKNIPKACSDILNTLEGNVTCLRITDDQPLPEMMNTASKIAAGKRLIFMEKGIIPLSNWLISIKKSMQKYGNSKIFGAKIIDSKGSLLHAGLVLDKNHTPVSAYRHLAATFPVANKERPFQILDHFLCSDKKFFHQNGGFSEISGRFFMMDLCLKINEKYPSKRNCIYLPNVDMVSINTKKERFNPDDSIYFFGKWNGVLWENQDALYKTDNISQPELNAAYISHSMSSANLIE
ncbi:hypothetical protein [Desulfospira joergensenii]|uniref:hypothetical protein n=1 Tax=Desulfospira joergensenii TaxID=53329 RepID=UPI0003B6B6D5|nr:hypothetical protein [Desulfospira joergensenii]